MIATHKRKIEMTDMISKADALALVHLHSDMLDLTNGRSKIDSPTKAVSQYKRLVAKTGLSIANDAFLNSLDHYLKMESDRRRKVLAKLLAS